MGKFAFYTYAYNAERTLERTVQSVLAQTEQSWKYYLVDNGSTDGTWALIKSLAEKDSRIVPLQNKENHVWESGNYWTDIIWLQMEPEDFFCFLDADDAYKPEFLEHMSAFMRENDLELAACGNDFIDANMLEQRGVRKLPSNLIVEGQGFSFFLSRYHQFMRTMWGKLYTVELLRRFDFSKCESLSYGWDTLFALENCRNAKRLGVLSESLHKYYVFSGSVSYRISADRSRAPRLLYVKAVELVQEKCGELTASNQDFLLCCLFNDVWDALQVLVNSDCSIGEKLGHLFCVFDCSIVKELLSREDLGRLNRTEATMEERRKELFSKLSTWMLSFEEIPDEQVEQYCDLGELLCAAAGKTDEWLLFQQIRIQFLFTQQRETEAEARIAELKELGIFE